MSLLNTEVLASLNQQHHADLVQEAEIARLLRKIKESDATELPPAVEIAQRPGRAGLLATVLALPGRIRLA